MADFIFGLCQARDRQLETPAAGEMIEHPTAGQNPHQNQGVHAGSPTGMPNFRKILNPAGAPAPGALPPGRPPVNSKPGRNQPSAQEPR